MLTDSFFGFHPSVGTPLILTYYTTIKQRMIEKPCKESFSESALTDFASKNSQILFLGKRYGII